MEKLMTAQQVADVVGMHVKTLYRLIRDNHIALTFVRKHGRMIAFRPSDVERYLSLHEVVRNGAGQRKPRKPSKARPGFLSDAEARLFFSGTPIAEKFTGEEWEDFISGKRKKASFPSDYFYK
jgi:excisionase family DNA binding protein